MQGLGTPVPAVEGEQAGPQASRSSNCNTEFQKLGMGYEDTRMSLQGRVNPFVRSSILSRTPPNATSNGTQVEDPKSSVAIPTTTKSSASLPNPIGETNEYDKHFDNLDENIKELSDM